MALGARGTISLHPETVIVPRCRFGRDRTRIDTSPASESRASAVSRRGRAVSSVTSCEFVFMAIVSEPLRGKQKY